MGFSISLSFLSAIRMARREGRTGERYIMGMERNVASFHKF